MLTIREIRQKLTGMNLRYVARESGVSYPTLYNFYARKMNSNVEFVEKLSEYFEKKVETNE